MYKRIFLTFKTQFCAIDVNAQVSKSFVISKNVISGSKPAFVSMKQGEKLQKKIKVYVPFF